MNVHMHTFGLVQPPIVVIYSDGAIEPRRMMTLIIPSFQNQNSTKYSLRINMQNDNISQLHLGIGE